MFAVQSVHPRRPAPWALAGTGGRTGGAAAFDPGRPSPAARFPRPARIQPRAGARAGRGRPPCLRRAEAAVAHPAPAGAAAPRRRGMAVRDAGAWPEWPAKVGAARSSPCRAQRPCRRAGAEAGRAGFERRLAPASMKGAVRFRPDAASAGAQEDGTAPARRQSDVAAGAAAAAERTATAGAIAARTASLSHGWARSRSASVGEAA